VDRTIWLRYPWSRSRATPIEFSAGLAAMIHHLTSAIRHRSVALIAAALLFAILSACSATKDVDLAQAAVAQFRELMAAHKFEQIYSDAGDDLKKSTTEQNLTRLLDAIDRKLGAFKSAQSNGWNVNYAPTVTSVTMKFKTQFERGAGVETFVYRVTGGKALLAGYHIDSADMMVN
jgi:Protein of unknown function (DUF4019)